MHRLFVGTAMNRPCALITGGTSGIGLGIARALASEYDLALSFCSNIERANSSLAQLRAEFPGTRIEIFQGLLANKNDCHNLYSQVGKTFSSLPSVLVNSAGRLQDSLLLNADFDIYETVIDEHLIVTMALSQIALKQMYKNKFGRIINLSSISSNFAKRGQSNYAAAKAGIEAFTRTVALEVAHRGITVNAIAPGLIDTPMTKNFMDQFLSGEIDIRKRIPAGRVGGTDEVGALAAFLCSAKAAYITGAVIPIDGGRSLGDPTS
jgi:3-oxoacyl-[acyl-carrier protein] reductase